VSVTATPWPALTFALSALLFATGLFTIATARRWTRTGSPVRVGCRDPRAGPGLRHPVRSMPSTRGTTCRAVQIRRRPHQIHTRTPLDWAGTALSRRKQ
jgi:hypothetical protein